MENVIYNELRMRGYGVDVGVIPIAERNQEGKVIRKQLEVDFVCNLGSSRYYIQSAYSLPDEAKRTQEMCIRDRFETAAGRLVFRLVNADMNRELLDQVPHVRILDLAVVFYVWLGKGNGGVLTAMVTREAADRWGVTPEGLWKLASVNAKREMPPVLRGIGTMLEETMAGEGRTLPGESQAGSSGEDFM